MKRIFVLFILFWFTIGGFAQENLFEAAIRDGLNNSGYYHIDNKKNKNVTLDDMKSYVRNKGYIILGGEETSIRKFGDVSIIVKYLDFTDREHFSCYVCSVLRDGQSASLGEMNAKGSFFLPHKENVYEQTRLPFISVLSGTVDKLVRTDNALWAGNVVNGFIDGNGSGFIDDNGIYTWFQGTFENGLPTATVRTRTVEKIGQRAIKQSDIKDNSYEPVTLQMCSQNMDSTDPLLSKALNGYLANRYQDYVSMVDKACQEAHALTVSNYMDFKPDYSIPQFISNFEKDANDPLNALPKAREVYQVYQMLPALSMRIRSEYYGVNLWSILTFNYEWFNKFEDADSKCLLDALEIAKWGKDNSKYGFKQFFSSAYDKLNEKYNEFKKKIESDRVEFRRRYDARAKENAEADRKREQWLAEHGSEIEEVVEPSGDLLKNNLFNAIFGGGQYEYSEDGYIKLKNGHKYEYNVVFDSDKRFSYYYVSGPKILHSRFDTQAELINGVIEAER